MTARPRYALAVVTATLGACDAAPRPSEPAPWEVATDERQGDLGPRPPDPVASFAALDPVLADRFPSLLYYPAVGAPLQVALTRGTPLAILSALAETMAPHRWIPADWDRAGFVDLEATTPGFVTRTGATSVSQPSDRHDLGCAGGFLEGVRLLLLPRLNVADLDRCEPETLAVDGGPTACDREHDFGWLAIANIANALPPARLPDGARIFTFDPDDAHARERLARPGAIHLCTASHVAAARQRERFYHHLFITLGDSAQLWVFDTTGLRGVAIEPMSATRFTRYFAMLLSSNRHFRYIASTASLACLAVRPM